MSAGPPEDRLGLPECDQDSLEVCDSYVVLIVDHATGARDTYGPFASEAATTEAHRHAQELFDEGLVGIEVAVVRHHLRPRRV